MRLHPAERAVSPPNTVLIRVGLPIDGIDPPLAVRPKPFHVVRMHQLLDLLDRHLPGDNVENFVKSRIPRDHATARIVLPPPKLGCVETKLQTVFALPESGFGTFEAGDVGVRRDQPDDFALAPLRLQAALHELRLASLIWHFQLELDRLAGEALADVRLGDREEFVVPHLGDTFADQLLRHRTEPRFQPLRMTPIEELVAEFRITVDYCDRSVVGDKAQLAQVPLRLLALDANAHPGNEDHAVGCQRAKQEQVRQSSRVVKVERKRKAWCQHEEIGRSSAEYCAEKARTEPADQRCDYNCGKERNELRAHEIWIDSEPHRRGNPNGHDGKGVGADSFPAAARGCRCKVKTAFS
jgi:hypothetical protein